MKERPILFSGPMVRAILEGRKTQTRRIIKCATGSFWDHRAWRPQVVNGAIAGWVSMNGMNDGHFFGAGSPMPKCPYGQPGTRLWVRETWGFSARVTTDAHRRFMNEHDTSFLIYKATADHEAASWSPSIHMPRWASRITLEVVSVRVERLQEISEEDAMAEGVALAENYRGPVAHFASLWEQINGLGSWNANPWVWVVEFKRITP